MKHFKLLATWIGISILAHQALGAEPFIDQSVPGTIKAVHFDKGGAGIGYVDTSMGNSGQKFRTEEDVDIFSRGAGSLEVRTEVGEILNFTVNVISSGKFALIPVYSLKSGVGNVTVAVAGKETPIALPSTGGHGDFKSFRSPQIIQLAKGTRTISLKINSKNIYLRSLSFELVELAKPGDEFYISKLGGGLKNGVSSENAFAISQVNDVVNNIMKPGDTLFILGGVYENSTPYSITVTAGGDSDSTKKIVGLDVGSGIPVFRGKWSATSPSSTNKSWSFLNITGASGIEIENLRLEKYLQGFIFDRASNVILNRISIENVREGLVIKGLRNSQVKNSTISKYSKRGVRMYYGAVESQFSDLILDGNGGDSSWVTEGFPFGVSIENPENGEEPSHDVTFLRVTSKNNLHQEPGLSYQNGDGFSIERTAYNMRYVESVAYNNTDAGWDDKSVGAIYESTRSFENKRNYRLWSDNVVPTEMHNILSAYARRSDGNHAVGLWTQGNVHITNSTFFENQDEDLMIENVGTSIGDILIENSILTNEKVCGAVVLKSKLATLSMVNDLVCAAPSVMPVQLLSPSPSSKDSTGKEFDPADSTVVQGYRGK